MLNLIEDERTEFKAILNDKLELLPLFSCLEEK